MRNRRRGDHRRQRARGLPIWETGRFTSTTGRKPGRPWGNRNDGSGPAGGASRGFRGNRVPFRQGVIDSGSRSGSLFFAFPEPGPTATPLLRKPWPGPAAVVSREGFSGSVLRGADTIEALLEAGRGLEAVRVPRGRGDGEQRQDHHREMLMAALAVSCGWMEPGEPQQQARLPLTLLNARPDAQALYWNWDEPLRGTAGAGGRARPGLTVITNKEPPTWSSLAPGRV